MKDIYELLNDINVDINDDDLAIVSDIEKKKLSKELHNRIVKVKKQSRLKRTLSIAVITLGILSSALMGLSFTAYAEDIPFIGNIFKFFSNDGRYVGYDENAKNLDLAQESNDIKISIMDTVFDGKTLFITYMIETSKDLGDRPWLNSLPSFGDSGLSATEQFSKIEDGKYISLMAVNHENPENLATIDVNWHIDRISTEANNKGTAYEGNWEFDFKMKAVESKTVGVNKTIENDGISFTANHFKITPMSIMLSYESAFSPDVMNNWDNLFVSVKITDDLGKKYEELTEVGRGWSTNWSATYEKLDPKASKLILTPIIKLSDNDTIGIDKQGKPIKANYRSLNSDADYKEIQLENIIVEIK